MQRKVCIEFYDKKPIEYMPVRPMYWCLWSEDYVKYFNVAANDFVHEITAQINEIYGGNWSHWDLDEVDYNTDEYI